MQALSTLQTDRIIFFRWKIYVRRCVSDANASGRNRYQNIMETEFLSQEINNSMHV